MQAFKIDYALYQRPKKRVLSYRRCRNGISGGDRRLVDLTQIARAG
jgi:hypothetical protein